MADDDVGLQWADYLVIALSLVISLGIGVFFAIYRGGQKTREEYMLGSRQMGVVPVCLSMFVTFLSAISVMGTPADTYNTTTLWCSSCSWASPWPTRWARSPSCSSSSRCGSPPSTNTSTSASPPPPPSRFSSLCWA
ncbi:hypothetical protein ACOMHN_030497 [Nucella lapillus]